MKGQGAIVFLAIFAIGLFITLSSPTLPPGRMIYDAVVGAETDYPVLGISATTLIAAIFNGVIYGVIIWLIYTLAVRAGVLGKEEPKVVQTETA